MMVSDHLKKRFSECHSGFRRIVSEFRVHVRNRIWKMVTESQRTVCLQKPEKLQQLLLKISKKSNNLSASGRDDFDESSTKQVNAAWSLTHSPANHTRPALLLCSQHTLHNNGTSGKLRFTYYVLGHTNLFFSGILNSRVGVLERSCRPSLAEVKSIPGDWQKDYSVLFEA